MGYILVINYFRFLTWNAMPTLMLEVCYIINEVFHCKKGTEEVKEVPSHEDRYNSLNLETEAHPGHMGQQCCDLDQQRHKASQPVLSWSGLV